MIARKVFLSKYADSLKGKKAKQERGDSGAQRKTRSLTPIMAGCGHDKLNFFWK